MKRLDSIEPKIRVEEGWMVQVYGRDRRLLCVLEPSHGWIFLTGCILGLMFATLLFNLGQPRSAIEPQSAIESLPSGEEPYLRVD